MAHWRKGSPTGESVKSVQRASTRTTVVFLIKISARTVPLDAGLQNWVGPESARAAKRGVFLLSLRPKLISAIIALRVSLRDAGTRRFATYVCQDIGRMLQDKVNAIAAHPESTR